MAEKKDDNKVKGGTVTYLEGSRIGVNTSGEKVGGTGHDKDNLKTDLVLDASIAKVFYRNADGTPRGTGPGHVNDLKNGDKISAGWVPTAHGTKVPTSITITAQGDAAPAAGYTLPGPLGSEHGPQAVQTGVSQPHLNYVNVHQDVGPGGGPDERADPATPDGTPDVSAKAAAPGTTDETNSAEANTKSDEPDLEEHTVPELKDIAAKEDVELASDDHKADIVRKIKAARRKK